MRLPKDVFEKMENLLFKIALLILFVASRACASRTTISCARRFIRHEYWCSGNRRSSSGP